MIRYFYWVGGGALGALIGIAFGAKVGYVIGLCLGDTLYHYLAGRHATYVTAA